jgi:hypothetical protein
LGRIVAGVVVVVPAGLIATSTFAELIVEGAPRASAITKIAHAVAKRLRVPGVRDWRIAEGAGSGCDREEGSEHKSTQVFGNDGRGAECSVVDARY